MADKIANGVELNYVSFDNEHGQEQSAFFRLPGEVRHNIYYYALTSYEDTNRLYDPNTYWSRPQYLAPRRTDTALLRCCKRAYSESWFLPWASADHTFWLTNKERAPGHRMSEETFGDALQVLQSRHGNVEIDHVRFFAQMFMLESGRALSAFLDLPHFHPKCVTITIRHTDWFYWEYDHNLRIDASWVNQNRFPVSVRHISMELESLERKKEQVDSIVKKMKENWYFTRSDNIRLTAKNTNVDIARWQGSSTWDGRRWIRDEREPDLLDYYIATVTWQREADILPDVMPRPRDLRLPFQVVQTVGHASVSVVDLAAANVLPGTPADQVIAMIAEYRQEENTQMQAALLTRQRENQALGASISRFFGGLFHSRPAPANAP